MNSKARENAGNQVVIDFIFTLDWLREWHEFVFWTNHRAK